MDTRKQLHEITAEGLDLLQNIAAGAEDLEFQMIEAAGPDAAAYRVEIAGDKFRWLVAVLQTTAAWSERFQQVAEKIGLEPGGDGR